MAAVKAAQNAPKVGIRIPKIESEDSLLGTDQFEHVTINGRTTMIKVGEYVEVSPEVYIQLRNKYPNL